jgi:hypothetical protein
MEISVKSLLIATLWLGAIGAPASAHHSFAMFDQKKEQTLNNAVVMQFKWANPHVYIVVKNDEKTYTVECGSPSNMREAGWKFSTLKIGDKVDLVIHPLRNGQPGGSLQSVILDGKKMQAF